MPSVRTNETSMTKGYNVVDAKGELINQTPFASEREASEAKRVYEDNCTDVTLPLRVVRAGKLEDDANDFGKRI